MKESFWGVLIVMLGLFGVMLINVFQKITIGNDEVYYLLKETNEAAMYDSIDFSYYRLTGDIKIVEDKFAENFARRFGQNIMMRGNYKITIQDVNEVPPRSSVKIVSRITSLAGDEFGIENRIDGILEAKYKLEEITDFLGITKEEWVNRSNINDVKGDTNSKACVITTIEDTSECMEGDIELSSWEDVRLSDKICQTDEAKNVNREINYKVCECGKWKEYTDTVASTIKKEATRYVYTWEYVKEGALREFRVSANAEVEIGVCTTKIEIYVPNKIEERVKKYINFTNNGDKEFESFASEAAKNRMQLNKVSFNKNITSVHPEALEMATGLKEIFVPEDCDFDFSEVNPSRPYIKFLGKGKKITHRMIERLLHIHEKIKSGCYPNSKQLAYDLETSEPTINRDIEYLRDSRGAPIQYDFTNRGYYYSEDYELFFDK